MKQRKPTRKKSGSTPRQPKRKTELSGVVLAAECVIDSAPALKSQLATLIGRKTSVTLDASAVRRIDTASLQVLAAFARDRREAQLPVEWAGVSAGLLAAAELLDLGDVLGLAPPATA
jgi:ABC-type transporter Mla MlaB component